MILHRAGNESPITIDQDKCLIRTVYENERIDCCAIFNGPNGTALRSYTDNVLVNGEPTAAQWLNDGDQIQLPCSTRIEVKSVTRLRPVFRRFDRTAEEIDAQLSGLLKPDSASNKVAEDNSENCKLSESESVELVKPEVEQEEVFLSPFSTDLDEIEEQTRVAPQASKTQFDTPPKQAVEAEVPNEEMQMSNNEVSKTTETESLNQSSEAENLESIFARVGVTNVGNIAATTANPPAVSAPPATPAAEVSQLESDSIANMRKDLENVFADVQKDESANEPELVSKETAVQVAVVTDPLAETAPTSVVPEVTTSVVPAVVERVHVKTVPFPEPVADDIPTPQPATTGADPLAELPSDLRAQLNDLVSSLEQEVGSSTASEVAAAIPVKSEQAPNPPVVEAPAVPAAVEIPVVETPTSVEVPVVQTPVSEPISDDSISSMVEAAMRSVEQSSAEETPVPPAVAVSEPVSALPTPVQTTAPIATPEPVVAQKAVTPEAVVTPEPAVTPEAVVAPEPVVTPEPEKKSQSVADILGSMGMDVPGADEMESGTTTEISRPAVASTESVTPPFASPAVPVPNPASPAVFANIPGAKEERSAPVADQPTESTDDIKAYMDRLLNRTGTEQSATPVIAETSVAPATVETSAPQPVEQQPVLSAEEFIPNHVASRPENYDKLREIANTSSRTAIRNSSKKGVKASTIVKMILCPIAIVIAAILLWFGMTIPCCVSTIVAIISGGLLFLDHEPSTKVKQRIHTE